MRQGEGTGGFRTADLDRDDGFAVLPRAPGSGEKMRGVRYALDVAEDDAKLRLNRKVIDEVADRAIELATAGCEIGNLQAQLIERPVDGSADRAALRRDRNGA